MLFKTSKRKIKMSNTKKTLGVDTDTNKDISNT